VPISWQFHTGILYFIRLYAQNVETQFHCFPIAVHYCSDYFVRRGFDKDPRWIRFKHGATQKVENNLFFDYHIEHYKITDQQVLLNKIAHVKMFLGYNIQHCSSNCVHWQLRQFTFPPLKSNFSYLFGINR
jgi:hypothetical protein